MGRLHKNQVREHSCVILLLQHSSEDSGFSGRHDLSISDMSECSKLHSLRSRHNRLPRVVTRQQFASLPKLDVTTAVLEVATFISSLFYIFFLCSGLTRRHSWECISLPNDLELLAFNAQKFVGHVTLATLPFQKISKESCLDCPWEQACQIWSL